MSPWRPFEAIRPWRSSPPSTIVHANQITSWKNELLSRAAEIFGSGASAQPESQEKIRELHEKIGELSVEKDFLERVLGRFPGPSGKR